MFTMGTDFKYQYAETWFRQLDKFIHYVNQVKFLLTLPKDYLIAVLTSTEIGKTLLPFKN